METVESTSKIHKAISDCLTCCYSSPTPLCSLAEFLILLGESGRWTRAELAVVRSAVVRILRKVAQPHEDDGLPADLCEDVGAGFAHAAC